MAKFQGGKKGKKKKLGRHNASSNTTFLLQQPLTINSSKKMLDLSLVGQISISKKVICFHFDKNFREIFLLQWRSKAQSLARSHKVGSICKRIDKDLDFLVSPDEILKIWICLFCCYKNVRFLFAKGKPNCLFRMRSALRGLIIIQKYFFQQRKKKSARNVGNMQHFSLEQRLLSTCRLLHHLRCWDFDAAPSFSLEDGNIFLKNNIS